MVPVEDPDVSGKIKYREYCQQSKLIPCSYFMAHIEDRELTLRYHQFSNDDVRAIARTLSVENNFSFFNFPDIFLFLVEPFCRTSFT